MSVTVSQSITESVTRSAPSKLFIHGKCGLIIKAEGRHLVRCNNAIARTTISDTCICTVVINK